MRKMVKTVYVKFNYHQLHTDKALQKFWKSGNNNNKNDNNICSARGPFPVSRAQLTGRAEFTRGCYCALRRIKYLLIFII